MRGDSSEIRGRGLQGPTSATGKVLGYHFATIGTTVAEQSEVIVRGRTVGSQLQTKGTA